MSQVTISGVYSVKYVHGAETLELNPDGVFQQIYVSTNGAAITNQGTWKLDGAARAVTLDQALVFDTGSDEPVVPPKRTMWGLPIVTDFGQYQFAISADRALMFTKQ